MIYLVGAGPGDPGLFTLRGLECMKKADAVVYDRLAPAELLDYAPDEAQRIYVGKTPGQSSMSQEEINTLLVRLGREGKNVVRLKGGDPFIFGRGGEEALELVEAGLDFEVVPGITAGAAAPAYAGIPVTHRGLSTGVAFITGHEDPAKEGSTVDWNRVSSAADTLVLYMGVGRLAEISASLIAAGRSPDTPVATIRRGTLASQQTVTGTLADIDRRVKEAGLGPPAVTVVGEVATLRRSLKWFDDRPLFGRRVVVTRARAQAGELSARLRERGADVVEFPTIRILPPADYDPLDEAIRQLHIYHWLIFTSVNGVEFFMERLRALGRDLRSIPAGARIAAIGPATAGRISETGLRVDVLPGEYRAEALVEELSGEALDGKRVLIPRAKVAREVLPEQLREAGAEVDVVTAYESAPSEEGVLELADRLREGEVDCVTFTASSTVENFVGAFGEEDARALLERTRVACIGPITAETAGGYGIRVEAQAREYTIGGLVEAVERMFPVEKEG